VVPADRRGAPPRARARAAHAPARRPARAHLDARRHRAPVHPAAALVAAHALRRQVKRLDVWVGRGAARGAASGHAAAAAAAPGQLGVAGLGAGEVKRGEARRERVGEAHGGL
jgi:hypothetical protein